MAFRNLYKSLKRFFSGEKLHFSCRGKDVELDEESLSVLKAILTPQKRKIIEKTKKLFPGIELSFTKQPLQYPCRFQNCNCTGVKVQRHLQFISHKFPVKKAKTYESFIRHQLNHNTLIVKHNKNKPNMCHICKSFYKRIGTDFEYFHRCKRQTPQMNRNLEK